MNIFDTLSPMRMGNLKPNEIGVFNFAEGDGGDGTPPPAGDQKPWFDALPDTLKTDPNITKYKTIDDFATGHLNVVKLVGQKGVIIPKADAAPEEFDKFYNTLGRPEKPEGYKLSQVEGLHKSIQITPEASKAFFTQAHKLGLTNQQADALNSWYLTGLSQALGKQDQEQETKLKEIGTKLQQEWGKDYNQNLTMAQRVLSKFGDKSMVDRFLGPTADPELLKVFVNVAKVLSEDSVTVGGFSNLAASAGEAKRKIAEITGDMKHPYNDEKHPDHNKWAGPEGEMRKLHLIAEGQE